MWFSFVLDDYDDLNWRGEMAAMFTLLDKLGITVEKVTCHHFSGDRRFLGTDPEPNAKLAKSIQHCSRVEHGTLTLHLNLFGFGQIERSWDGFKFKSSFPTSFCWHLASTSSPFLGAFPVPTDQVPPRHWRPVAALLTLRALRRRVAGLVLLAPISTKAEMVEAVEAVELGEKLAPEEGQLLGVGELVTGISKIF